MSNFYTRLLSEVINSLANNYNDNHDFYRFGQAKETLKHRLAENFMLSRGQNLIHVNSTLTGYSSLDPYLERLNWLYETLEDEKSKQTLIKLIAFRILGKKKVKLPLSTPEHWQTIRQLHELEDEKDFLQVSFENWKLKKTDLNKINYPIQLYYSAAGTYYTFVLKQYEYPVSNDFIIKAETGDYVIDAGACWGDTALYFANAVGANGKVFSFEFIPSNVNILRRNLALNPHLENRVEIIEKAVWSESDTTLYYDDNGPASRVGSTPQNTQEDKASTLSIDDLVNSSSLNKLDFIKMDIEGAEPRALQGARKTLEKFKPKLAIAIYHSLDDFVEIPRFLDSLGLGYKFYLGHYTIHIEETILYAV
ncbi:MAG TPA: FkbM family methyltransferase [Pyrinomonadaceae bacterium]|jgi:FkbM family methyltransferase